MGDGDAARRRRLLQADDESDRGAETVVALDEDVGEARRRPRTLMRVARSRLPSAITVWNSIAHSHAVLDARELDQGPVAHGLEKVAAMVGERRTEDVQAGSAQAAQRAALIRLDVAGKARHIERGEHRQAARRTRISTCISSAVPPSV